MCERGPAMAICPWCRQEMFTASTCTGNGPFDIDGRSYAPVPAEEDCGDCGVRRGGLHHPGCDIESCPCCGEQRIECNCANPERPNCRTKTEYVGADDQHACFECPSCGAEIDRAQ